MDDLSGEVDMGGMIHSGTAVGHGHTPLKVLTVPFTQFGHPYQTQRKATHTEAPYYQQLRKGRGKLN